ncbi:hypothetical protein DFP72DRAFT_891115 [Ephemerocybe angulata]|uniref:Wax synthase domain-containing protein n=1 Tax=Ephemerocybe angulata TaxID=980116 RepID=A0A8H6I1Y7_9AGAR|nr:hypothetical protein DFP72DRAFT_891115 [Tulosesus angulatus]
MSTVYQELLHGAHDAFRVIIPLSENRIPMTRHIGWIPLLCYVPFVFLAALARRPDTYLIRLLLLPGVIYSILLAAYRFTWTQPELNVYNWGQCLFAAVFIAKALEYAFNKEGMLKVGESRPGVYKGKARGAVNANGSTLANGNGHQNGSAQLKDQQEPLHTWWYDAFELAHTMRGLKWKFGEGVHIPPPDRPQERGAFLRATFISFLKNFLLLDVLESLVKLFPGVGSPVGGSIFYSQLSPPLRYVVSTTIHMLTGSALLSGFGMVYDLITLFAVGVCNSSPRSWPPLMDNPWISESMHEFWSKRWHQLLRQTFLVFGGYPGEWIAGKFGMVFGAFLASGLFHECAMYSMNRGYDHSATIYFALQGPVLVLERLWKRLTGRRVSGWPGRFWVYFNLFVAAQPMVNAWHRRGLGGSPFRIFVLPLAQRFVDSLHK